MFESPPFWMYFIGFLLVLGPLVTVHELGHYLVGRWLGVGAEAFSVGFGKELVGRTDRHGTRWRLAAIPLGGYVQFKGDMNPASIPDQEALKSASKQERAGNFHHAALWRRALIVLAGPATNLAVAIAIFAAFFIAIGKPVPQDPEDAMRIAKFAEDSAARDAGMQVGDQITTLDGEAVTDFQSMAQTVLIHPGRTFEVGFLRDTQAMSLDVTVSEVIDTDRFGNTSRIGRLGIYSATQELASVGALEAVRFAMLQCWDITVMMGTGIKQILVGERSIKELGGPVKIAKYSGEQMSLGLFAFVWFIALISLNLAFINLLPIPALDGGHLAFYAAEAIRRKPASQRSMELAYGAGMAFLLVFMVVVTFNDLVSLSIFGS